MVELMLESTEEQATVLVQEEPVLEIALPQVFAQPELTTLQRGKLPHVEALVARIYREDQANPGQGLGPEYQQLVAEFQPLFTWAMACWDYLLSTAGCRFIARHDHERYGRRGDYRAVTDRDFSRMVHAVFRACVLEFAQSPSAHSLSQWLRERLWPRTVEAYDRLQHPPDARQRFLTPYSYLRCVPYQFLNPYHDELVYMTARRLPTREWEAINIYFLHFYTEAATANSLGLSLCDSLALVRQGLIKLLVTHRLVYCLLRQIERY